MGRDTLHRLPPFLLGPVMALSAFMAGPNLFALDAEGAWRAASAMVREAGSWKPGGMDMTVIELTSGGAEKSREEGSYLMSYGPGDAVESRVVRVVKNGKDITAERRAEVSAGKKRGGPDASGAMGLPEPLNPAKGAKLERGMPRLGILGDLRAWAFPFSYKAPKGLAWEGEVWIGEVDGRPLVMECRVSSSFPGLRSFSLKSVYGLEGRGGIVSVVEMEADLQILLSRKRFSTEMRFSAYAEVAEPLSP